MFATEFMNYIKLGVNNNPIFGDDHIISLINAMIKSLSVKSDFAKEILSIPAIANTVNYVIPTSKIYKIIDVWYGQDQAKTLGQITVGHKRLQIVEREFVGRNFMGFWTRNVQDPITNIYNQEINLTFDPTDGYYLMVEYTSWATLQQSTFAANEDLALYIPESAHEVIAEKVIARLKLNDRDQTASVNFNIASDREEELADSKKEKVTFLVSEE